MQRRLSADDSAFQQRLREYFTTTFPQALRDKVKAGEKLSADEIRRSQATLAEAGLATPGWPTQWGGRDWTSLQKHIWNTELQAAYVPLPLPFNASMVGPVIATFGSEELKQRFLPQTATAEIWWCQGFSEPGAGSDLASLRTTAVREGDEYVVNGQKTWTTLAQHADWMFALVRTDPDAPKKQAGISFLLLDMRSEGVTVRPIRTLDGGHDVNEVFFDNVRVPADQLVGEENKGWDYAKFLLGNERVGVANTGLVKRWLTELKDHAQQVSAAVALDPLPAAVATLRQKHPNIQVFITEPGSPSEVINDVRLGRAEIGLTYLDVPTGPLVTLHRSGNGVGCVKG
ncbi:acyl-CoA dehydrogenase family protein [Janibacter sp. G1551]|uniref:acyl-CoA dehydrogenase family protein n=1 Tax=Janibacter sp. G1551 TaxID=3420440 RepID=UPI003D018F68